MLPLKKQLLKHILVQIHEYNKVRICITRKIISIWKSIKTKIFFFRPKGHTNTCICLHITCIHIHMSIYASLDLTYFIYPDHIYTSIYTHIVLHIVLHIFLYYLCITIYTYIQLCSYMHIPYFSKELDPE